MGLPKRHAATPANTNGGRRDVVETYQLLRRKE